MQKSHKVSKEQLKAVAILSVGTFLEYFDLMLYVHMAVLLDDLFFPTTNPLIKSFIPALSFCSTHLLRPFGALFFGYLGDLLGRKLVIVMTTMTMACCCIILAGLPTYDQIGITAPIVLTLCRMVQGMSASAEMTGAEIYVAESVKPPAQYPLVAILSLLSSVGGTAALSIGVLSGSLSGYLGQYSWRCGFLLGATIGIVGAAARRTLKEAAEFANRYETFQKKLKEKTGSDLKKVQLETPLATSIAFFCVQCARPPCFYFVYIHCGGILKNSFGFTNLEVMSNNFWVNLAQTSSFLVIIALSYILPPLKIVKTKAVLFCTLMTFFPFAFKYYHSAQTVFIFQIIGGIFLLSHAPASPIFFKYFPVFKRFKYVGVISAMAKLATYVISSFGLALVTKYFGQNGIFIILAPVAISFFWSLSYFEKKEIDGPNVQQNY
jgi:MFS transporter, MHS family, proline/betaine transporter